MISLNRNSSLEFPKKFKSNVREVTITGEAFFDVKPNPLVPFVIHAGNAQIKVLGTSFNVNAYPETKTVEVVVKTGKVQVSEKNREDQYPTQEVILDPGEKGTFFSENNVLEKSLNTDPNYMAWKTHDLIFNEVPLKDVVKSLEKVYHVDIQISDPELNNKLITVHFEKKPIDFVLDVIRQTLNLSLTEKNGQFIFSNQNETINS